MLPNLSDEAAYRQKLLVFGYIRENKHHHIPHPIVEICEKFAAAERSIIEWKFVVDDTDLMDQDILAQIQCGIRGGATCVLQWVADFPDPDEYWDEDSLRLNICVSNLPSNCKHYAIYYEVYCDELKHSVINAQVRRTDAGMFSCSCLVWNKCKTFDALSCKMYIDILYMKCINDDGTESYDEYKSIKLNTNMHYEWNIDNQLLTSFKAAQNYESFYYIPNHYVYDQFAFIFVFIPKWHQEHSRLELKCVCLPKNISRILAECKIFSNCNDQCFFGDVVFRFDDVIKTSDVLNGDLIDKVEWAKYGI